MLTLQVHRFLLKQQSMISSKLLVQQTLLDNISSLKDDKVLNKVFKEGGEIYEMAKEGFGENFRDGTHFTVPLFPDKVFRVNKYQKCLELCRGYITYL